MTHESHRIRLLLILALGLAGLAAPHRTLAAQVASTWVGASGDWNDSANWAPDTVPNNGSDTYAVTLDGSPINVAATVDRFFEVDTLTITPGDRLALDIGGTISIEGGALTNNGVIDFVNEGSARLRTNGPATTLYQGTGLFRFDDGAVNQLELASLPGSPALSVASGGTLHFQGAGLGAGIVRVNGGLLSIPNGTLLVDEMNVARFNAPLEVAGQVISQGGSRLEFRTQLVAPSGFNVAVTARTDSSIDFDGSTLRDATLAVENNGIIEVGSGSLERVTATGVDFSRDITLRESLVVADGLLSSTGQFRFDGNVALEGDLAIAAGAFNDSAEFFPLLGGSLSIRDSKALRLSGAGKLEVYTPTRVDLGAELIVENFETNVYTPVMLGGSLGASGGKLKLYADIDAFGTVGNQLIAASNNGSVLIASRLDDVRLVAESGGTITLDGATLHDVTIAAGSVSVNAFDSATASGSLTIDGTLDVPYGSILSAEGGDVELTGTGAVRFGGGPSFSTSRIAAASPGDRFVVPVGSNVRFVKATSDQTFVDIGAPGADGLLRVDGELEIDGLDRIQFQSAVENSGEIRVTGAAAATLTTTIVMKALDLPPSPGLARLTDDDGLGVLRAEDGSTITLSQGGRIVGGVLETEGSGTIRSFRGAFEDVANTGLLQVERGGRVDLMGELENTGTVLLGQGSSSGSPEVYLNGAVALTGGGTLDIDDFGGRFIAATGADALVNEDNTIVARTDVYFGYEGSFSPAPADPLPLTNRGTVVADNARFQFHVGEGGQVVNEGTIELRDFGGAILLSNRDGAFVNHGDFSMETLGNFVDGDYVQTSGSTTGTGSFFGLVTIEAGELDFAGRFFGGLDVVEADITVGDPIGVLDVYDQLTLGAASSLAIDLLNDSQFDKVNLVSAAATLGGALTVELVDQGEGAYQPVAGDAFPIVVAGGSSTVAGAFDSAHLPAIGPGLVWQIHYGAEGVILEVVEGQLPGDYNTDGAVNAADYTLWRDTNGQSGVGLAADGNGDGSVDDLDYDYWAARFGTTAIESFDDALAVPEPAALALLVGALAGLIARRR